MNELLSKVLAGTMAVSRAACTRGLGSTAALAEEAAEAPAQEDTQAEMSVEEIFVQVAEGVTPGIIDLTDEDGSVEFGNNKSCRVPMRKTAIAEVEKANEVSDEK